MNGVLVSVSGQSMDWQPSIERHLRSVHGLCNPVVNGFFSAQSMDCAIPTDVNRYLVLVLSAYIVQPIYKRDLSLGGRVTRIVQSSSGRDLTLLDGQFRD